MKDKTEEGSLGAETLISLSTWSFKFIIEAASEINENTPAVNVTNVSLCSSEKRD